MNPAKVRFLEGFTRYVRNIGHFGTGDVQVKVANRANRADLAEALELARQAYEAD